MRLGYAGALVVSDLAVLALDRPDPGRLIASLGQPHAWLERVGADGACAQLAGAALWAVAAWLAVGLLAAAAAARLPGVAGRRATLVARLVLPRALRTMLAGSAGLGILLAPVAAAATTPLVGHGPTAAAAAHAVPTPTWPLHTAPHSHARHHPQRPTVQPPRWPMSAQPAAPTATGDRDTVTVAPGDSLWLIAARRLGAHASPQAIAEAWPRWYATNRNVVGGDPTVIVPGQVLHAPADIGKETP
ncbi:LysM peptidoglycan-binding domain-containing protein [uncultured Jatrophihabitans sp.]|uniref:LysM peptidoglycan-binding domain-containing protein n=1 Tax=uncultured Jatrophihabitans sp. TaxID=1610747 RepID=UPI0035CC6D7B